MTYIMVYCDKTFDFKYVHIMNEHGLIIIDKMGMTNWDFLANVACNQDAKLLFFFTFLSS